MSSVDEFLAVGDDVRKVIAPVLDFASLAITREFVSTKIFFTYLRYVSRWCYEHISNFAVYHSSVCKSGIKHADSIFILVGVVLGVGGFDLLKLVGADCIVLDRNLIVLSSTFINHM